LLRQPPFSCFLIIFQRLSLRGGHEESARREGHSRPGPSDPCASVSVWFRRRCRRPRRSSLFSGPLKRKSRGPLSVSGRGPRLFHQVLRWCGRLPPSLPRPFRAHDRGPGHIGRGLGRTDDGDDPGHVKAGGPRDGACARDGKGTARAGRGQGVTLPGRQRAFRAPVRRRVRRRAAGRWGWRPPGAGCRTFRTRDLPHGFRRTSWRSPSPR